MVKKKVLITGSNGLLGQNIVQKLLLRGGYNIYGVSRGENIFKDKPEFSFFSLDLTDAIELKKLLDRVRPDAIIHTAAITNVDACELDPTLCKKVNVDLVGVLATYCANKNTHLIHLSTDFIFDGIKGYYREEDTPDPLNVYGRSKLLSEELIRGLAIKHTIIRTILVYGLTRNLKNNIVLWLIRSLRKGENVRIVTDQFRMPTLVDDLAASCISAMENEVTGTFHVSSDELMSIYEIALAVADCFDLDQNLIHPIATSKLGQPAKRPVKTGFILDKSVKHLGLKPVSFRKSLQLFKNQLQTRNPD